jgi:hypothetical protein
MIWSAKADQFDGGDIHRTIRIVAMKSNVNLSGRISLMDTCVRFGWRGIVVLLTHLLEIVSSLTHGIEWVSKQGKGSLFMLVRMIRFERASLRPLKRNKKHAHCVRKMSVS